MRRALALFVLAISGAMAGCDYLSYDMVGTDPRPRVEDAPDAGATDGGGSANTGGSLALTPAEVDFGQWPVGCPSVARMLKLENTGAKSVSIMQAHVVPSSLASVFPLSGLETGPVGAHTSVAPFVQFNPAAAGLATAQVLVNSDENKYLYVGLRGTGVEGWTDTFSAGRPQMVDVLFVVDNSASMSEKQNGLASAASTFLAHGAGLDYHVGVVTTDMESQAESGRLQGSPSLVTPGGDPVAGLAAAVRRGTQGSATEQGLAAMKAALSAPLSDGANRGFLAEDSRLAVIVLSDEDDQSPRSVDEYVSFLWSLRPRHRVSLSAVVGDPAPSKNGSGQFGCTSAGGDAEAGTRYLEARARTGGVFQSICGADWNSIAGALGRHAFGSRFVLSFPPAPGQTITVKVNGVAAARDTAWTHKAVTNEITFVAGSEPADGATVTVEYRPACGS